MNIGLTFIKLSIFGFDMVPLCNATTGRLSDSVSSHT